MKYNSLKIAIEGCCHGELNQIYKSIPRNTDLLIICGDFQSLRNESDLRTLNVPNKFKKLGDFHEYYKGTKKAPVLTLFIGGNHECSSYLKELKFGGWVAPNIYYLGEFGSVWFKGLKISGLSGIYNKWSFLNNYFIDEALPYNEKMIRSIYHVKPKNFLKLYLMKNDLDIVLTHDWPSQIEKFGNLNKLLREKHFFKTDIRNGTLGSPLNKILLDHLKPRYWFSGHLHVKFEATVKHKLSNDKGNNGIKNVNLAHRKTTEVIDQKKNNDEISLDMDEQVRDEATNAKINKDVISLNMDDETNKESILREMDIDVDRPSIKGTDSLISKTSTKEPNFNSVISTLEKDNVEQIGNGQPPLKKLKPTPRYNSQTYFLALDKCLPKRKFLEIVDIPIQNTEHPSVNYDGFYYDERSIVINKVIEDFIYKNPKKWRDINVNNFFNLNKFGLTNEFNKEIDIELSKFSSNIDLTVPQNFKTIAPTSDINPDEIPLKYWENNQTFDYCNKFNIPCAPLETID